MSVSIHILFDVNTEIDNRKIIKDITEICKNSNLISNIIGRKGELLTLNDELNFKEIYLNISDKPVKVDGCKQFYLLFCEKDEFDYYADLDFLKDEVKDFISPFMVECIRDKEELTFLFLYEFLKVYPTAKVWLDRYASLLDLEGFEKIKSENMCGDWYNRKYYEVYEWYK